MFCVVWRLVRRQMLEHVYVDAQHAETLQHHRPAVQMPCRKGRSVLQCIDENRARYGKLFDQMVRDAAAT